MENKALVMETNQLRVTRPPAIIRISIMPFPGGRDELLPGHVDVLLWVSTIAVRYVVAAPLIDLPDPN